jgi:hypothetical protein
MAMSLQELSDRFEINDLLVAYSHAIDTRNWDALDSVFTEDAVVDYSAFGGPAGPLPEIKAWLDSALAGFAGFQHLVAAPQVVLDGDRATAKTYCHNPMVLHERDGKQQVWFLGLWYHDELVRTPAGWRIRRRREERCYELMDT